MLCTRIAVRPEQRPLFGCSAAAADLNPAPKIVPRDRISVATELTITGMEARNRNAGGGGRICAPQPKWYFARLDAA